MGSDGDRDNAPTQTNQATDSAANTILQNPAFAPVQSNLLSSQGNPGTQKKNLVTSVATDFKKFVPASVSSLTTPPQVAFNIQNKLGLNTGLPKPKIGMKKGMQK